MGSIIDFYLTEMLIDFFCVKDMSGQYIGFGF